MKNVTIVGAGLTGLVIGYRLSQKGYKVTIYEKNNEIGGLLGGFNIGNTNLEKAYHHIFKTDNYIIDLIKELGLQSQLRWYPEKTALYYDGKMYPFMGPKDLFNFKPLGIIDKVRLGLVKIWLEKDNNWQKYEKITAVDWMKKWCGNNAYKVIWEPLLRGKFHQYANHISMAWLWARIHTRANSDGKLGYLEGGFQQLVDKLAERIKQNGGEIKLRYRLLVNSEKQKNNIIVNTGPLKEVEYVGAVNLVFTTKQNLSPYYWHNINDPKSPFLAVIQQTNLVDKKNYEGKHVYYLGTYGDSEQSVDKWLDHLIKIFPKFDKKLVEDKWVFRFEKAQHIVTTDYKVSPYKIGKKYYQVNFAQIYPEDRGINFAVREAEKMVGMITKD